MRWELRLAALWGCSLGECRARLTAGELALWIALGEAEGPWWGERGDFLAARISQTVAAAAGTSLPLSDFLPPWSTTHAPKVVLLPWPDAAKVLTALVEQGRAREYAPPPKPPAAS